jgi:hypothetical protein
MLLDSDETALHLPNPGWQPVPQYALELPQYEYCEQQSPNFPPEQVIPAGDAPYKFPQRAFVVTLVFTGTGEADVEAAVWIEVMMRVEVFEICAGVTELQVPNGD